MLSGSEPERQQQLEFLTGPISFTKGEVQLGGPAFDDGKEAPLGVLVEVRRGAMRIERSLIVILFVEEEPPCVACRAVCQVHPATRLGARVRGEFVEERDGVVFVSRHDDIGYGDADHTCAPGSLPKVTAVTMHKTYPRQGNTRTLARVVRE